MEQDVKKAREHKGPRVNTPQRISSPDQLTDYLRVTNPGVWVLLASIILFLAGIFAWFYIGTLETDLAAALNTALTSELAARCTNSRTLLCVRSSISLSARSTR